MDIVMRLAGFCVLVVIWAVLGNYLEVKGKLKYAADSSAYGFVFGVLGMVILLL